jgi:hypothetical protein
MRSRMVGWAVALLALGAETASAQGASWTTSLGGGVTLPIGDQSDIMDTGFHALGTVGRRAAGSRMELGLELGYHRLSNKLVDDESHNVLTAMARINHDLGSTSYLLGAIGMFRNEYTEPRVQPVITNTRTAIAVAGGAGMRLGQRVFGEARVLHAFTDEGSTTMVPITLGVRF